ncbi:DinB family protein [Bacillus sp. JCM 19034]|uniref:DinB family protein n=1 Tax=Bacillus sp. JCM 19034 TaxID=1481928 RepID=UPI0022B0A87B|nr:DinB family protein [Bacillus sp. JCM 19034]
MVSLVQEQEEKVIKWKPSSEQWSILQIASHVEEANRFWLQELRRTVANPEIKWGRGLNHRERLAAVEESNLKEIEVVIEKIRSFKTTIRQTLVGLNDGDLLIEAIHINPKFGTKRLSLLLDHFMVEHLDKHVSQIERNINDYHTNQ